MGGQIGEDERSGNQDLMYEFIPTNPRGKQWARRANMLVKRGHANEGTRPYGCGLIMISGTTDRPTGKDRQYPLLRHPERYLDGH